MQPNLSNAHLNDHQSLTSMQVITNDQEYRTALQTIQTLLAKGSQAVTTEEISLITTLRHQASAYEKIKYDHSIHEASQSS